MGRRPAVSLGQVNPGFVSFNPTDQRNAQSIRFNAQRLVGAQFAMGQPILFQDQGSFVEKIPLDPLSSKP